MMDETAQKKIITCLQPGGPCRGCKYSADPSLLDGGCLVGEKSDWAVEMLRAAGIPDPEAVAFAELYNPSESWTRAQWEAHRREARRILDAKAKARRAAEREQKQRAKEEHRQFLQQLKEERAQRRAAAKAKTT